MATNLAGETKIDRGFPQWRALSQTAPFCYKASRFYVACCTFAQMLISISDYPLNQ